MCLTRAVIWLLVRLLPSERSGLSIKRNLYTSHWRSPITCLPISAEKIQISSIFNTSVTSSRTLGLPLPDNSIQDATSNSVSGPRSTTITRTGWEISCCRRRQRELCFCGSIIFLPSACKANKSNSQIPLGVVERRPYDIWILKSFKVLRTS